MSEFARSQWAKAARAVASAAAILDMDPDSAASRAYYAAFHGVTAVLYGSHLILARDPSRSAY